MKMQDNLMADQQPAGRRSITILKPTHFDRITKLANLLEADPGKRSSIRQLARQTLMNDYDLKRMFRQVHGKTIHCYRVEQRLLRAKYLLLTTAQSIAEIAADCGYKPDYFTIVFSKKTGSTPTQFRKQQTGN